MTFYLQIPHRFFCGASKLGQVVIFLIFLTVITDKSKASQIYEGQTTMQSAQVGGVMVQSAEARYILNILLDDPIVNGSFKYEASARLPYSTIAFLICQTAPNAPRYYVAIDSSISDPGKGYGLGAPRSPNWNRVFKLNPVQGGDDYLDEARAKAYWQNGFSVVGMLLVPKLEHVASDSQNSSPPSTRMPVSSGDATSSQSKDIVNHLDLNPADQQVRSALPATGQQVNQQLENLHAQQEAAAQRQKEQEQQRREAAAELERKQAEAQQHLADLRQQQDVNARKRQEAADKFNAEQEARRAEQKAKNDRLAAEFARENQVIDKTVDHITGNMQNLADQWAKSRAESRQHEQEMEQDRRQQDEAEEARKEMAQKEADAQREYDQAQEQQREEQQRLRDEEDRIQREAVAERQRIAEQERLQAAQQAKAKQLRMEAKEKNLKNDAAATLNSINKHPVSTTNKVSVFDQLTTLSSHPATNRLGTNVPVVHPNPANDLGNKSSPLSP